MTFPAQKSDCERPTVDGIARAALTTAFCGFLLAKLAAPEVLDTRLSVTSQLLLLLATLLLTTTAAAVWYRRGRSSRAGEVSGGRACRR